MKRIVIRLSDFDFERIRFEALEKKKSIREIVLERILSNPFSEEVQEALEKLIDIEFKKFCNETEKKQ